jgi:hypothetical protein
MPAVTHRSLLRRDAELQDFTLKMVAPSLLRDVMTDDATALDLLGSVLMFVAEVCVPLIGLPTVCNILDELCEDAVAAPWLPEIEGRTTGMTRSLARLACSDEFDTMELQAHELLWVFVQAVRVVLIRMFPQTQIDGCIAEFSIELRTERLHVEARRLN